MFNEFITTVYHLVINGRWAELKDYLFLIKELLTTDTAVITPGIPQQKE